MILNSNQKEVLSKLLDLYEKSKTYTNENKVNQSFSIKPDSIFASYYDNYTDINKINDFNRDMVTLQELNLIDISSKNNEIKKLTMNTDNTDQYYQYLNRKPKATLLLEQYSMYQSYLGKSKIADLFINDQIDRLEQGKKAEYEIDVAENIIKLLNSIEGNSDEILERELSISVLNNSKEFENHYRTRIVKILSNYTAVTNLISGEDNKREIEHIVLAEYNIYPNPSYVYFKGEAKIELDDGRILEIKDDEPLALSSYLISKITNITIFEDKLMTVENLSSFHRIQDPSFFYVYLAGYHNSSKQALLKKIINLNSNIELYHFGDLDPDGFYILDNLNTKLNVSFIPYKMSIDYLIKYNKYTKPLEKNDITKANNLIKINKYKDICQYMIDHNIKLEQEIISWLENRLIFK